MWTCGLLQFRWSSYSESAARDLEPDVRAGLRAFIITSPKTLAGEDQYCRGGMLVASTNRI